MAKPSNTACRELEELSHRLQGSSASIVRMLWKKVFDAEDRKQLGGNLEAAHWQYGGVCQMYRAVRDVSAERAVIEIAFELDFATEATRQRLLHAFGEVDSAPKRIRPGKPLWDLESRELYFDGVVIRTVRNPQKATNIVSIFNAFQQQEWPRRIDAPAKIGDPGNLHKSISSLNRRLEKIRFRGDGTGEHIEWFIV